MSRVLKLKNSRLMLVSDIQGHQKDFDQVIKVYQQLKKQDKVDYLVFCGDLMHGYPGYEDKSDELYIQIRFLQKKDPSIIFLLGNHELAHIMHWELTKGDINFTHDLEVKIKPQRVSFSNYLSRLPFAIITDNGLLINHTGPSIYLSNIRDSDLFENIKAQDWYDNLDFQKEYLIEGDLLEKWKPNYGASLMQKPSAKVLWETFMNKNEYEYEDIYESILDGFLNTMSKIKDCHLLISSHISEGKGFKIVNDKQFRLCTSHGAKSDADKKYLLVNTQVSYVNALSLESCLYNLWES
ncbi:MAG: hypothetical protein COB02_04760 [Candidatus Cloacimonadota bacterium]|nr:MAG: hypothetical protein COB02_04760 [Candidatus Cloacimonadota bacterium]